MMDLSRYLGIPYKEKGRGFSGCDCWGLVRLFYLEEFGIEIDGFLNLYSGGKDVEAIRKIAEEEKRKWLPTFPPGKIGDVVEIPLTKNNYHIGVVATPGYILHIEENGYARTIREKSFIINKRIRGYFRHHELAGR